MKIRFTKPYTVLDGTGTRYDVGHELTCNEASAQHFIRRGVAEAVKRAPRKKTEPNPQAQELPLDRTAEDAAE